MFFDLFFLEVQLESLQPHHPTGWPRTPGLYKAFLRGLVRANQISKAVALYEAMKEWRDRRIRHGDGDMDTRFNYHMCIYIYMYIYMYIYIICKYMYV